MSGPLVYVITFAVLYAIGQWIYPWPWSLLDRKRASEPAPTARVVSLEHELGIAGHESVCPQCTPRLRLPERFSRGGVISRSDRKSQLSHDVAPASGGDLHIIYADECFLSEDGVCVRRDDIHQAARIKADRSWICPLHD